jgi:hypothetical protein
METVNFTKGTGTVISTFATEAIEEYPQKYKVDIADDNSISVICKIDINRVLYKFVGFADIKFAGVAVASRADLEAKIDEYFYKEGVTSGGGSGGGVLSVTGNVVNNTDPTRPVITTTVNTRTPNAVGNIVVKTDSMMAAEILGSQIKAECIGMDIGKINAGIANNSDGVLRIIGFYIREACTITGARWFQNASGVYTADNYNGIGLYTISAGVLTLVASSVDDGNLWKAAPTTWVTKNFSTAYPASVGMLYLGMLYNNSAQTTAPTFGCSANMISGATQQSDFANNAKIFAFNSGNNVLPTNLAMSSCPGATVMIYAALY